MSDYLHHLVVRTLSSEAGVRPQLLSAFEPPPLDGGFTLPADFELEREVESDPPGSLPLTALTPFERGASRERPNAAPPVSPTRDAPPRQVVPPTRPPSIRGNMPPLEPNEDNELAPAQPLLSPPTDREPSMKQTALQRAMHASPDSALENSPAVSRPFSISRTDPIPVARHLPATPTSDTVDPAPAVVPRQTVESEEPRPERIALVAIGSIAPAAPVVLPSRLAAPPSDARLPAAAIHRQTVEPEVPRSERFAASIRPLTPAAPEFSPSLPPAVAPTIHVTIGRVEVRATPPPPAASRAQTKGPSVMSLEEYLGRRAAGGRR